MSIIVDNFRCSSYPLGYKLASNSGVSGSLFAPIRAEEQSTDLFEQETEDKKGKGAAILSLLAGGLSIALLLLIAKSIRRKPVDIDPADIERASGFSFGVKKLLSYENITKKFKDETTKHCDVSIKGSDCVEYFFSSFKEKLPTKYVSFDANGEKIVKECIELETFEMLDKGKGLGSKKIQEIIEYAKERTEGRFYVMAQKIRGNPPPLLFYYKNGLRSVDDNVNLILEKISNGELPYSRIPNQTVMYLP